MFSLTESDIRHIRRGGGFRWYAVDRDGFLATLCDFEDDTVTPRPSGPLTHNAWNLASGYFWRLVNPHAGLFWYERKGDLYRQVGIPEGVPLTLDRLPETVRCTLENIVLPVSFREDKEFCGKVAGGASSPLGREENNRRWRLFCDEFRLEMKPLEDGTLWLFESDKAHYPGGIVTGGFCAECWKKRGDFSSLRHRREERDDFLVDIADCPICAAEFFLPGDDSPLLSASDEPVDERLFRG